MIGIVVTLLKPEWDLSTDQVSLLNSATMATSSIAGLALTLALLPEPMGKSLEDLSEDAYAPATAKVVPLEAA